MKKYIVIVFLVLSIDSYSQIDDLPWQAGLTRIVTARFYDGKDSFDIGENYVEGIILVDFSTSRAYIIGNGTDYFILTIKERLASLELDKQRRTGESWNIFACNFRDKEWLMDIRYNKVQDIVQTNLYQMQNDTLKMILFDSKIIPQEKLE